MKVLKFIATDLCLLLFVFVASNLAQSPATASPTPDDQPIKVSTVLLNVPVIATDRQGRYVSGLKKENFTVLQDGEKQEIEFFADEKAPMSIVILIDVSVSTRTYLDSIKDAARGFVKIFRPEDRGMIVTFAGDMTVLQEFTSDQKVLDKSIKRADLSLRPGSNMQDAVYDIVTKYFAAIRGRKAIIVLTDGMVNGTAVTNEKLLSTLAESDILVYPILFGNRELRFNPNVLPKTIKQRDGTTMTSEEFIQMINNNLRHQMQFMNELGPATGGRLIEAKSSDFKGSFQSIADELKNQYVVGFYPSNAGDGKSHNIAIKTDSADTVLRSKRRIKLKLSNADN